MAETTKVMGSAACVVDTPVGEDRDAAAPFGERHDLLAEMVDGRHDRRACIGTGVRAGRVERGNVLTGVSVCAPSNDTAGR